MVEVKAMTTAEYLALPSLERDALVAVHVLGWPIRREGTWIFADPPERAVQVLGPDEPPEDRFTTGDPHDWAGMKLMIDAMRKRGFHCQLTIAVEGYGGASARFTDMRGADTAGERYIRLHDSHRFTYAFEINDLPLAASIAALRAVGWLVD